MLRIEPVGPGESAVALATLFWRGPGWDAARWRTADGADWAVRARCDGDPDAQTAIRIVEQYRITTNPPATSALAPLDRTRFELGPDGFAEVARHRAEGGPNLHPVAIRLPAVMRVGAPLEPLPGATVTLTFAGPLRLALGDRVEDVRGACLRATFGPQVRDQWLVAGVGEVALGAGGAWDRWLVAWSGGGRALFGGVDPALLAAPPPLPPYRGGGSPDGGGIFG